MRKLYTTFKMKQAYLTGTAPGEVTGFIFESDTNNVYDQDGNYLGHGELSKGGIDVYIEVNKTTPDIESEAKE